VITAMSRPMINHRGPEFAALFKELVEGLQWALRTRNDVLLFPASGTGGLEAAVVNLLSPDEQVLFCTIGSFGDRWANIAAGYGADVVRLEMPWGQAVVPEDVGRVLDEHPSINQVFVTHNETSTGVTNPLADIANVVKSREKILAVDSVSGASCLPLNTDDLGIDVLVTGSQKGWMAPPGLTMAVVSEAAYAVSARAKCPRWYFDFARERKYQERGQTYTTPPIVEMRAVAEGIAMLREEGLENAWTRHSTVAEMVRTGMEALGCSLFAAPDCRSNTVTAIDNPTGSPEKLKELLALLRTTYGLVLAGGQDKAQGQIFRIGHLGMIDEAAVYDIFDALEQGMRDVGVITDTGAGLAAAREVARRGAVAVG